MNFSDPETAKNLYNSSNHELDTFPFGIVKMDKNGTVVYYNAYESELSGLSPDQVVGRDFFTSVAPCTNNSVVARRYQEEHLDETLDYVFTYRMKPTPVRLRLLRSPELTHQFLLVERR